MQQHGISKTTAWRAKRSGYFCPDYHVNQSGVDWKGIRKGLYRRKTDNPTVTLKKIGGQFRFKFPVPNRLAFFQDGDEIGFVQNQEGFPVKNRVIENGKIATAVRKHFRLSRDDTYHFGCVVENGKITMKVYTKSDLPALEREINLDNLSLRVSETGTFHFNAHAKKHLGLREDLFVVCGEENGVLFLGLTNDKEAGIRLTFVKHNQTFFTSASMARLVRAHFERPDGNIPLKIHHEPVVRDGTDDVVFYRLSLKE